MFTGLIEGLGRVIAGRSRHGKADGTQRLRLRAAFALGKLPLGASVAVNGVCLTVVAQRGREFDADLGPETLARTTLGTLQPGASVNLERALRVGDALGGHLVSGHVDGVGTVRARRQHGAALELVVAVPEPLLPHLVAKGSVTVDGVSLTVNQVDGACFHVMLIPHTLAVTNLDRLVVGDRVNIETDLIAKHVVRLLAPYLPASRPTGARRRGRARK